VVRDITSDSGAARAAGENAGAASPDFTLNVPAATPDGAVAEPDLTLDAPGSDGNQSTAAGANMIDFNFDATIVTASAADAQPQSFTHDKTVVMNPENQDDAAGKTTHAEGAAVPMLPDFNLDIPGEPTAVPAAAAPAAPLLPELKFDEISLNFDDPPKTEAAKAPAAGDGGTKDDHWYDVQTKFDLAKAYQEMGDKDGTREILLEVIKEGDAAQQAEAKALLDSLG
jgi:pilus assembly protein FimV